MISLAFAFAPVAAVSLFAAAVPVLTGIRQRHAATAGLRPATEAALEITGSSEADGLVVAVRNRTAEVRTLCLSVSVYDASGAECARFDLPRRRVLPGRVVDQRLDLHALEEGSYQAVVVAELEGEWFGARYGWTRAPHPTELAPAA